MAEHKPTPSSPWFDSVPDELRWKPLHSNIRADVTVIGAGIVGVLAAWKIAQSGKQVILLEKNHVATGETGFSTAFITRVPDVSSLSEAAKRYGVSFMQQLLAANRAMQQELFSIIEREHLDCNFRHCSSYYFAYREDDAVLHKEWDVIKQLDTSAAWMGTDVGRVFSPAQSAVLFPDEGRFDVRKFLFGLLATETGKKIRVYEESPVTSIDVDDGVYSKTEHGSVKSDSVVLASGSPTQLLPETKELFSPVTTYVVLAEYAERPRLDDALLWDIDHPYHYFRLVNERTVMLGGEDHPAHEKHDRTKSFGALEQYLREKLPGNFSITHTWTGTLYDTADELPYATEHPHYRGKVFFVSGLAGNGIVMGALAGTVAASLAMGTPHVAAELLSLERTGVKLPEPVHQPSRAPKPGQKSLTKKERSLVVWKGFLLIAWLLLLLLPAYAFFQLRGGFDFLTGQDLQTLSQLLFPLIGLYAFFFVWSQVMIGTNRDWLHTFFPGIIRFHRIEGVFALLFAVVHPTLLLIGVGPAVYFAKSYVPQSLHLYVWLGYLQLTLIILTAGTAMLMRLPVIRKVWRWIHFANYAVFVSVWTHSWFLGSDVQATNLRYLWYFYGGTFVLTTIGRIVRRWTPRHATTIQGTAPEGFVTVGPADSFPEGQPHCVEVNGKKLMLVNNGGSFHALDNVCSHAGGPLCEGTLENGSIVCPWHASRFDVKTGAVQSGPARLPQKAYTVRIVDNHVCIKFDR